MNQIIGKTKTVKELLKDVKYSIDYYQREYKWEEKHICELIDDLSERFLNNFQEGDLVSKSKEYGHYFLGSIILTQKGNETYIVDGQQRLTSLTLLLIYLGHLLKSADQHVPIDSLILSDSFGEMTFNLQVEDRLDVMQTLFKCGAVESTVVAETDINMVERYKDIERSLPEEIKTSGLPHFCYWLMEKVHLVEITTQSDDDAYTVFETMNDRGLPLTPSEMLKGYLLAQIDEPEQRIEGDKLWKSCTARLNSAGKQVEPDFFKAWIRSQYANTIRETKKDAESKDFERIGSEYHRWIRDHSKKIGLEQSGDFFQFIQHNLGFYSNHYLNLIEASVSLIDGLEWVRYNADQGFTLQYMLMLSPVHVDDDQLTVKLKFALVSQFLDIFLTRRLWNYRSTTYAAMRRRIFTLAKTIRHTTIGQLSEKLIETLEQQETFDTEHYLRMHQQNRRSIHRILARITCYLEQVSNLESHYTQYLNDSVKDKYEVEHIWANHFQQHADEFSIEGDFQHYRNKIGGLLLLPKSFNASYGDSTYEEKLPHYTSQNILARSLNPQCYEYNPGFLNFVHSSNLPFTEHQEFKKKDIDARSELYRQIAKQIWNPDNLLNISDLKNRLSG